MSNEGPVSPNLPITKHPLQIARKTNNSHCDQRTENEENKNTKKPNTLSILSPSDRSCNRPFSQRSTSKKKSRNKKNFCVKTLRASVEKNTVARKCYMKLFELPLANGISWKSLFFKDWKKKTNLCYLLVLINLVILPLPLKKYIFLFNLFNKFILLYQIYFLYPNHRIFFQITKSAMVLLYSS